MPQHVFYSHSEPDRKSYGKAPTPSPSRSWTGTSVAGFIVQKLLSTRTELYCSQGEISGGCATHAAAAALTILGIIGTPSRISSPRCEPNARRFWRKMKDAYA